jgi:hypothetical protein
VRQSLTGLGADESVQGTLAGEPAFVALVDFRGSADSMECVRQSLLAMLEALPGCCHVGLVGVFDDTLLVFNVRSTHLHVRRMSLESDVPLSSVLSLPRLVAPLRRYRTSVVTIVEQLPMFAAEMVSHATSSDVRISRQLLALASLRDVVTHYGSENLCGASVSFTTIKWRWSAHNVCDGACDGV